MIFLSYAWADAAMAHQLNATLKLSGQETWIDFERLDLGGPIEPQLQQAVRSCQALWLVDTPTARDSRWIQFELDCAARSNKPVRRLPPQQLAEAIAAARLYAPLPPVDG